jgi:hypothetical protein
LAKSLISLDERSVMIMRSLLTTSVLDLTTKLAKQCLLTVYGLLAILSVARSKRLSDYVDFVWLSRSRLTLREFKHSDRRSQREGTSNVLRSNWRREP